MKVIFNCQKYGNISFYKRIELLFLNKIISENYAIIHFLKKSVTAKLHGMVFLQEVAKRKKERNEGREERRKKKCSTKTYTAL